MPGNPTSAPHADAGRYIAMLGAALDWAGVQLVSEACALLRQALRLSSHQLAPVLADWNRGELACRPIEAAAQVLAQHGPGSSSAIRDRLEHGGSHHAARQAVASALEHGSPLTVIAESVFAYELPAVSETAPTNFLHGPSGRAATVAPADLTENVRRSLVCARIVSHAQAIALLRLAAARHGWPIEIPTLIRHWNSNSHALSPLLGKIQDAFARDPALPSLLPDPSLTAVLAEYQASWRKAIVKAIALGVPMPASTAALAFYDSLRNSNHA